MRHLAGAPSQTPPRPGGGQTRLGPLANQGCFKLRQGGENPKHQAPIRRRRIKGGSTARQHFEPDLALAQVIHQPQQVFEVASQPVKLPDHQRIPRLQGFETGLKTWPAVLTPRGVIFIKTRGLHPGSQQGIALEVQRLRAITFRDPHVPNEHQLLSPPS